QQPAHGQLRLPHLGDRLRRQDAVTAVRQRIELVPLLPLLVAGCAADAGLDSLAGCPALGGSAPAPTLSLAADLLPSANSHPARTQYLRVNFDASWNAALALDPEIAVKGSVVDDRGNPVAAVVSASRPALIPGLPPVTRSTSTGPSGFTLNLPKGKDKDE